MATTSDFRNGLCLNLDDKLYTIVKFLHVKPGKGPAFVRTKIKEVETGKVIDKTFNSGVKVDTARLISKPYQYLYKDDMGYHFMNTENYEQISLQDNMIENELLLKEEMEVSILFHDETDSPISCELPPFVTMEVTYCEPGIKGDTSSGTALKPAKLDTGLEIKVPLFVNTGDFIKVDTRDLSYSERVKK